MADAIDYRKLWQEEKRKASKKKGQGMIEIQNECNGNLRPCDSTISAPVRDGGTNTMLLLNPFTVPKLCPSLHFLSIKPKKSTASAVLSTLYYIPQFVNSAAFIHKTLVPWLQGQPSTSSDEAHQLNCRWKHLKHSKRRVMLVDETLCANGTFPEPLQSIVESLIVSGVFPSTVEERPNHILINEYDSGMGIMAHTDGPEYNAKTATISIGDDGSDDERNTTSHCHRNGVLFKFIPRLSTNEIGLNCQDISVVNSYPSSTAMEILLESNGSLVVFQDDAYRNYLHQIDEVEEEYTSDLCANSQEGILIRRGYRISITLRHKKMMTTTS
jgi:hypothetical protein